MENRKRLRTSVEWDQVSEDGMMSESSSSADVSSSEITEAVNSKTTGGGNMVFDEELRTKFEDIGEVLHARAMMGGSGCSLSKTWDDIADLFKSVQSMVERSTSNQEQLQMSKKVVQARKVIDDIPQRGGFGPSTPKKTMEKMTEGGSGSDCDGDKINNLHVQWMTDFFLNAGYVASEEILTAEQAVKIAQEMAMKATAVKNFTSPKEYREWSKMRDEEESKASRRRLRFQFTARADQAFRDFQCLLKSVLGAVTRSYGLKSSKDIIRNAADPSWLSMQGTKVGVLCSGREFPVTQELLKKMKQMRRMRKDSDRERHKGSNVAITLERLAISVGKPFGLEPEVLELGQFLLELIFGLQPRFVANGYVRMKEYVCDHTHISKRCTANTSSSRRSSSTPSPTPAPVLLPSS